MEDNTMNAEDFGAFLLKAIGDHPVLGLHEKFEIRNFKDCIVICPRYIKLEGE